MKLYKRISLLLSLGIMGIGLTTFRFSPAEANTKNPVQENVSSINLSNASTSVANTTPTPVVTATPTPEIEEPNDLIELSEDSEIYKLIVKYLNAKLSCDKNEFEDIVTDTSDIDEESLQQLLGTINSFENIKCYSKKGIGPVDYVVYYTYLTNITTISTPMSSVDFSCVSLIDGEYKVVIGDFDDEVIDYVHELLNDTDVAALISDTFARMEEETASDEDLLAYRLRIYYGTDAAEDLVLPSDPDGSVG